MTNLPRSRNALQGALPSTDVVQAGDGGLSQLGAAIGRHGRVEKAIGEKQATDALSRAEAEYAPQYAQAAAAYTGESGPGFASAQGQVLDVAYAKHREGLSDEALNAYDRLSAERKVRLLGQAGEYEGQVLGGIERQQAHAAQTGRVMKATTAFSLQQRDVTEADRHNGDTLRDPAYVSNRLQRFDAAMKETLEATPEFDRPALAAQLNAQRASLAAQLNEEGFQLRDEQARADVTSGLEAIYNRVAADPAYAGQAALDAGRIAGALPVGLREKAQARIPNDILKSVAGGFQARNDVYGLEAFLKRPDVQTHMDADLYQHYTNYVGSQAAAAQRALQQDTVSEAMENELVTMTSTGESSGFDSSAILKAYGPVDGPVMVQKFNRALSEARSDYQLVSQASDLSAADMTARLDILKPKAGDPEFAAKQKRYERALALTREVVTKRMDDPAGFDAASKDGQTAWLKAESGAQGAGQAWAAATLKKQAHWGIAEASRSILPANVAKGMVTDIQKAEPERKDEVMMQTAARLAAFGDYDGMALRDLQKAGLDGRDAAMLNASNGDSVMIGNYVRLAALSGQKKLTKDEADGLTDRVAREAQELIASYGYSMGGTAYADSLTQAITVMAKGHMAQGESASDAARLAVKAVAGQYRFHQTGWRIPKAIADRGTQHGIFASGLKGGASSGMGQVAIGAYNLQRALVANPARLWAGPDTVLTPDQVRQREAGRVADGRWVTLDDDSGLQLVVRDQNGGFRSVKDAQGRNVVAKWDELDAAAATSAEGKR